MFDHVLQAVETLCKAEKIPMLGKEKAEFLADCVEKAKPTLIVECGTAIGYSGLWMLRTLRSLGTGHLITIEIDPHRAAQAQANFERAGMADLVESHVGDAQEILKSIQDPVDFLLLDNNFDNYFPCFQAIKPQLTNPATLVADNVGIGAEAMADYLGHVREHYDSETHWFEVDLPWVKQDAIEVSRYRR